jgi:hypothetical protein
VLCLCLVVLEIPDLQCTAVIAGTRGIRMAVPCVGVPLTASVQHVQDDARLLQVVRMESTPGHLLRHDGCTSWLPITPLKHGCVQLQRLLCVVQLWKQAALA